MLNCACNANFIFSSSSTGSKDITKIIFSVYRQVNILWGWFVTTLLTSSTMELAVPHHRSNSYSEL